MPPWTAPSRPPHGGPARCPSCGQPTRAGRCRSCELARWTRVVRQEFVRLVILIVITAASFWGTRSFARSNAALRRDQAAAWFMLGQEALRSGRGDAAIAALRRSAVRDPGQGRYRLALAEALATNHLDADARRELLALREAQPEDPAINLHLARVEARSGDADAARRYYESALGGLWRREQGDMRRATRIELVDFLLAHDQRARALSELLVLDVNVPEEADLHLRLGAMFLRAGDPRRALDHFTLALSQTPKSGAALAGAGQAAFELGDYRRALRHLAAVPLADVATIERRDLAALVLASDPLLPRLAIRERQERLAAAADRALATLYACRGSTTAPATALDSLVEQMTALQSSLEVRNRPRSAPAAIDDGLDLVVRAERAAAASCGPPTTALDRALLLIGRQRVLEDS